MGTVALDGTKIHANASRHSALSYEHAGKIEAQLKAEVAALLARAEAADQADVPDGMSIPDELARREERLAKLAAARAKIEARAEERYERETRGPSSRRARRRRRRPARSLEASHPAPGGRRTADGSDQSDRRSVAYHAGNEMEDALSALRHLDKIGTPLVLAHGTLETPKFQRQTRDFAAALVAAGKPVQVSRQPAPQGCTLRAAGPRRSCGGRPCVRASGPTRTATTPHQWSATKGDPFNVTQGEYQDATL
jgi:hypothetical protein